MSAKLKIGSIDRRSQQFSGGVFWQFQELAEDETTLIVLASIEGVTSKKADLLLKAIAASFFEPTNTHVKNGSLENKLSAINHEMETNWGTKKGVPWKDLSCAVAEISHNHLSCSSTGNTSPYLIREGQIVGLTEPPQAAGTEAQTFPDFSFGSIMSGDRVLITHKSLFNYIGSSHLTSIISKLPVHEACKTIENVIFPQISSQQSFVTIIVQAE